MIRTRRRRALQSNGEYYEQRHRPQADGSLTVNSEPKPTPWLCTSTVPSWSSTKKMRTNANPKPNPPSERTKLSFAWANRSNTVGSTSAEMPQPCAAHLYERLRSIDTGLDVDPTI